MWGYNFIIMKKYVCPNNNIYPNKRSNNILEYKPNNDIYHNNNRMNYPNNRPNKNEIFGKHSGNPFGPHSGSDIKFSLHSDSKRINSDQ